MDTTLSTITTPPKPKPKRKRKPPSEQRGRKNKLGHGRSAGQGHTNESLAAFCRRITNNGQTVAQRMHAIAKGLPIQMVMILPPTPESPHEVRVLSYTAPAPLDMQMKAMDWLTLRGFGKPNEHLEIIERPAFNIVFLGHNRDPLTSGELNRPPKALPPAS